MAKDTSCNIKKFAFASLAEASLEAQKKQADADKKAAAEKGGTK
jgi:hypothetical protein